MRSTPPLAATALLLAVAFPLGAQSVMDLPRRDRDLDLALETLWSVGSLAGAEWETFGDIRSVAFDGRGNLHVLDAQSSRVVVVGPDGRFLRSVGRAGEGPGELRMPAVMVVQRDGTVAVADMGHRAFVVYGPDGEFRHQASFASPGGMIVLGQLFPDPAGGAAISAGRRIVTMEREGPGGGPPPDPGQPIVRFELDADGGSRTLARAWQPPRVEAADLSSGGVRLRLPAERAFEPTLFAGMLPDGSLALSDSSAWAVKVVGPDGRTSRILRRPIEPRPTSARIERQEKERRLAEIEGGEGPRMRLVMTGPGGGPGQEVSQEQVKAIMRQRLEALTFYPEVPVVQGMVVGWGGKVWLRRRGRDVFDDGPVDVVDAMAGSYLGTLDAGTALPDAFGPDGRVAYIERDELDVPRVVVRRLPAALR